MVCGCVCEEEVVCEPPHPILGAVSDNLLHTQHTTHIYRHKYFEDKKPFLKTNTPFSSISYIFTQNLYTIFTQNQYTIDIAFKNVKLT